MIWSDLARKGQILVVDDAIENIRILHHALKDEHDVVFALCGEKALEIAGSQPPPDLILLDAMMPGKDGYTVCAELKQSTATQDIPVIFVTALSRPEDETRALAAGAVDFITKPVNAAVVRARVRTHLTLKRQSDLLRQMTLTDGLTGVANRRCFDEALEQEWRRCARDGSPLVLFMIDIDYFKGYNDRYGHPAGDICLAAVAGSLNACVRRPPDMVARYGGEEFAVILPQQTLDGARVVAQRMLDRVRGLAIPHAASSCAPYVTVSLGMAAMTPTRDLTPATLVSRADARLYDAKAGGRDRYCGGTETH
jgi:diguanylate cyclase (GGDEF)-like protein